jgi:integrase
MYTTLRAWVESDGGSWDAEEIAKPHIEAALRGGGLPIPARTSQEWAWLVWEFDERISQLSAWALERQEGRRVLPGVGALPLAPLSTEVQFAPTSVMAQGVGGPTLSQAFAAYKDSRLAGDGSRSVKATHRDYEPTIRAFIELYGDLEISGIQRETVGRYRLALTKMPLIGAGMAKMSVKQRMALAERDDLPLITAGTVKSRMRHLSAVLSFAVTRGWLTENPINAGGIGREVAQAASKQQRAARRRKHYERAELASIFSSAVFLDEAWAPPRASFGRAWYWLPVLMFYSGARVEELAQMLASEVRRSSDGIPYLSILESADEADGDRTVKTSGSRRMIPLHADVIARGFLDYVASLPAGGRLFPELEPCPKGRYSTNFAKRWGRYLRETVRLHSPASPSHGFRHTFKTLAREAGIPEEIHDAITGHAGGGVGRSYGEVSLSAMARDLDRFPPIEEIIAGAIAPVDSSNRAVTHGSPDEGALLPSAGR